jgi:hypothetical protein
MKIRTQVRRGLVIVPVVLGLGTPSALPAVTVPHVASVPPTRVGTETTVVLSFAAEGAAELMGTAGIDGDSFAIARDNCSGLEISGACTIAVRFSPMTRGQHRATLRLPGARGDAVVTLSGIAYVVGPKLSVSPEVLSYQPLTPGLLSPPQRVLVSARGDLSTLIVGTAFEGPAPTDFVVTRDTCTRVALAPGARCDIDVRATPSAFGGRFARLRVLTDPATASVTIGLAASTPPAPLPPPPPPPPPSGSGLPWSFGIVAAEHFGRRTTVRLYSSFPASARVALIRRRHSIRRRALIDPGLDKVVIRRRLRAGGYRVRVVARRRLERRTDSVRLHVRR